MAALTRRQRDIGQPLQMKSKHAEIKGLFDELDSLVGEMLLVAHEREYHAHSENVAEREFRGKIDRDDALQTENNVVDGTKSDFRPT